MRNIANAVAAIESRTGAKARLSDPFYSEPWGYQSPNRFINVALAASLNLAPTEALRIFRQIEIDAGSASHRTDTGAYVDRIIDIDIIGIDNLVINTPELTVPHPKMALREFVLAPMAQIAPHWLHPILQMTPQQLLDKLSPTLSPE